MAKLVLRYRMDKAYEPKKYEDGIYEKWEQSGAFQPSDDPQKEPFVVAIPPPNVTGTLHAGHSMFITIQDILIRWHRMRGFAALWIPGTDHAAIATESVVLKNLEIKDRNKDISREKFLEEARKWTDKTHARIVDQIRKMGASCDWTREAYTFDEPRNHAVNKMFKMLYDKGLIYRGDRMVNWSVGAQSVLADDEVDWEDRMDTFYSIRCGEFIVGTVRAETKCSDSPLFVNPDGDYARVRYIQADGSSETVIIAKNLLDDEPRRKKLLNLLETEATRVELVEVLKGADLVGQEFEYDTYAAKRKFVVMADAEAIDMDKGTGAMTISVLHAQEDYELAKRHGLDKYRFQKIDFEGNMTAIAGPCAGMKIEVARKKSAEIMKDMGLLVGEDKNYLHRVPVCYRSGTVVEPMVSRQWFIDVEKEFEDGFVREQGIGNREHEIRTPLNPPLSGGKTTTLKKMTAEAVRKNQVKIIPERFEKTYFHWIDNLRDWCISRQIWWGHRIPVWYRGEELFVGTEAPKGDGWKQDEDTLDTWFSSALWPFSILSWPDIEHPDYKRFYPTSVLETGHDIIFFWVARMIMFGKFATGKYPFHTVYLHGLVCDAKGQKMSKSKGNGIDPLEIIEKYGTDALRLSLIMGTTPGNNANLGEEKIAGCRNFCNKLWNISRFVLSQGTGDTEQGTGNKEQENAVFARSKSDEAIQINDQLKITNDKSQIDPNTKQTDLQKWLSAKTQLLIHDVNADLNEYSFGAAAEKLWNFTWNEFADWAIEAAKAENNPETNSLLRETLKKLLRLWHPFIPFVTEKIWEEFGEKNLLISSEWPTHNLPESFGETNPFSFDIVTFDLQMKDVVSKIRSMRKNAGVDPTKKITAILSSHDTECMSRNAEIIKFLGRIEHLEITPDFSPGNEQGATDMVSGITIFLPSSGMIDPEAEKARVKKELEATEKQLLGIEARLANTQYLEKAPPELIEQTKKQAEELKEKIATLKNS